MNENEKYEKYGITAPIEIAPQGWDDEEREVKKCRRVIISISFY